MDLIEIMKMFGFPIAMCGVLMWWTYQRETIGTKLQIERETKLSTRLDKVQDEVLVITRTVVVENTDAMRRMTHELGEIRAHCAGKHGVPNV
jgi:hypothetical protein